MHPLTRLLFADQKLALRDPLLVMLVAAPLLAAAIVRWGLPALTLAAMPWVDLRAYHDLIAASLTLLTPPLMGMVAGFLMLDERDEGTLLALAVTPLPRRTYIAYRLLLPVALTVLGGAAVYALSGLAVPAVFWIPAVILSGLSASFMALCLVAVAGNKIEGLAMGKLLNLLVALPIAAYFLPAAWEPLLWWNPFFWPFHIVWSGLGGAAWTELLSGAAAGLLIHGAYLWWLARRLGRTLVGS